MVFVTKTHATKKHSARFRHVYDNYRKHGYKYLTPLEL